MSSFARGSVAFSSPADPIGDGLVTGEASAPDLVAAPAVAAAGAGGGGGGGGGGASYLYMPMPQLMGAPAYARPPRLAADSPRPFDPDDLPIEAMRSAEDLALAADALGGPPPAPEPTIRPSSNGGLRGVASRLFGSGT